MFGSLGMAEIGIIFLVAVLIFGPRQLPKLGRSIGETIREFRKIGSTVADAKEDLEETARSIKRPL